MEGIEALTFKIDKMQEDKKGIEVFIYHKMPSTQQYFPVFQNELVIIRGASIVPLSSESQIPQFLQQLQNADLKSNPFDFNHKESETRNKIHTDILLSLCKIPRMGEKKARMLLEKFGTINFTDMETLPDFFQIL